MAGSNKLIGVVVLVLMISALGGTIFGTDGLAATDFTTNAPAWVVTLLTVGAGAALVKLLVGNA